MGGDRIAGLLEEAGLALREEGVHGRIERVEILAEAQAWNCSRRSWMVCAIDVPTLPPSLRKQGEQADRRPAQILRDVDKGRHIERSEDHREAGDHHHSRPDDLPRADVEIQPRHPVIPGRHDEQARWR